MADQDSAGRKGLGRRKFLAWAGVSAVAAIAAIMLRRRLARPGRQAGSEDGPGGNSLFTPRDPRS